MSNFLLTLSVFLLSAHAAYSEEENLFEANHPNMAAMLGIEDTEWQEIQSLTAKKLDYCLWKVEKSPNSLVGAYMQSEPCVEKPTSGPVFFFGKSDDGWFEISEMSAWRDRTSGA